MSSARRLRPRGCLLSRSLLLGYSGRTAPLVQRAAILSGRDSTGPWTEAAQESSPSRRKWSLVGWHCKAGGLRLKAQKNTFSEDYQHQGDIELLSTGSFLTSFFSPCVAANTASLCLRVCSNKALEFLRRFSEGRCPILPYLNVIHVSALLWLSARAQ